MSFQADAAQMAIQGYFPVFLTLGRRCSCSGLSPSASNCRLHSVGGLERDDGIETSRSGRDPFQRPCSLRGGAGSGPGARHLSVRPIRLSITSLAATGCMAPRAGNMEVMTATMA
jgi:hypothetical protein